MPDTHMAQGAERFTGTWWLPSEPNRRPGGVLIVHADGQVRLELDGALSTPPRRSHADEQVEYEIIVGRVGVRQFTLYKSIQIEYLSEGNRHARQTLLVETVFDGLRAANADDLRFDAGGIEIEVLHEWAKYSRSSGRIVSKKYKNDPPGRTRLVYDSPPALTAIDNGLKLVLVPGIAVPQRVGHAEMNTWHMFGVELPQPLPFEEWHTLVLRPLQTSSLLSAIKQRGLMRLPFRIPPVASAPMGEDIPLASRCTATGEERTRSRQPI